MIGILRKWRQRQAWGTHAMRQQLHTRFMEHARVFRGERGLKRFSNSLDSSPNLYVYFAGRQAGYVHEWQQNGSTVTIGHLAVAKELEGKGFGEPLLRGFAESVQREQKPVAQRVGGRAVVRPDVRCIDYARVRGASHHAHGAVVVDQLLSEIRLTLADHPKHLLHALAFNHRFRERRR